MKLHLAALLALACSAAHAANQTATLSPVVVGGPLDFSTTIGQQLDFGATLPSLHSFSKATFTDPVSGRPQWLLLGGMTNGLHELSGATGFEPAFHNRSIWVVDPASRQAWSRTLVNGASGLTSQQVETIATTNAQHTQQGQRLYVAGGYGFLSGSQQYETISTLTAVDLPGLAQWAKGGAGTAAQHLRQISDPLFQVTGGELATTANGKSHLVFGQNYPANYDPRLNGEYTRSVRTFRIVDDGTENGLAVADVVTRQPRAEFRRRDLNVVPTVDVVNGVPVEGLRALAGVFTPSFGQWTVPVDIDSDGNATQRGNPAAADTFKQGMNGYRSGTVGLYSAASDKMHTLLLGGIGYQFFDPATGLVTDDPNLPFASDSTVVTTDALGRMTQHLLPTDYPDVISTATGQPLLLGTETEFFLADGVPTYANGVIKLDELSGTTLVGYLFGGIAAEQPNFGSTHASNAVFPVYVTVPEPGAALTMIAFALIVLNNLRFRN